MAATEPFLSLLIHISMVSNKSLLPLLKRPTAKRFFLRKIYLVCEGTKTELPYFGEYGKRKLTNFSLYFYHRKNDETGDSNPVELSQFAEKIQRGETNPILSHITYTDLNRALEDEHDTRNLLLIKRLKEKAKERRIDFDSMISSEVFSEVVDEIGNDFLATITENSASLKKVFRSLVEMKSPFYPAVDHIALIVDRDHWSFTETQYDKVFNSCCEKNVHFVVTNPCFEFFLILHHNNVSFDNQKMLDNKRDRHKNTYAYNVLKQYDPNYEKNRYNVESYVSRIEQAKKALVKYSSDLKSLKESLGSNIPQWMDDMEKIG